MVGKSAQKAVGKSDHKRYARIPKAVLLDKELSLSSRCVYAYLAMWVFEGNVARIGLRKIARELGIHYETAQIAMQELKNKGHITIRGKDNERRFYVLHSGVYGKKTADSVRNIGKGPSGNMRIVSLPRGAAV